MGRSCIYVALLRMTDEDTRERAIASGPGVREAVKHNEMEAENVAG